MITVIHVAHGEYKRMVIVVIRVKNELFTHLHANSPAPQMLHVMLPLVTMLIVRVHLVVKIQRKASPENVPKNASIEMAKNMEAVTVEYVALLFQVTSGNVPGERNEQLVYVNTAEQHNALTVL
jgi:hypothetical protein